MFEWKWDFTIEILPRLFEATQNTLIAACLGYMIALVLGLVFALAQRTPYNLITRIIREFIELIRSTPLVLQIFFVFYVAPQFGIRLSPWVSGMIAIGLHYAAYLSEVYRAGIDSVPMCQGSCRLN
jgi:polar amino acid transport system permease protein